MTISEHSRHAMFVRLEGVLGEEVAATLMEHLPPVGWADVATRRDLDHQTALLGAELRTEMAELRTVLRTEIAELRTELRSEMSQLAERMFDRMTSQTRTLVFTVLGASATVATATLSAVRLG